jgi:hypothetical protein
MSAAVGVIHILNIEPKTECVINVFRIIWGTSINCPIIIEHITFKVQ